MDSSNSFQRLWREFRGLTHQEVFWLVSAWLQLPLIRRRLSRNGFVHTKARLEVARFQWREVSDESIDRLARLVHAAGNHHPCKISCLPRSLLLWSWLRRWGVPCQVCLGVTELSDDRLQSHAWVEVNGRRLNEPDDLPAAEAPFHSVNSPR